MTALRDKFTPLGCNTGDSAFDRLQADINTGAQALLDVLTGDVPFTCGHCGGSLEISDWMDRRLLLTAADRRVKEQTGSYLPDAGMSLALSLLRDRHIVKMKIGHGVRVA